MNEIVTSSYEKALSLDKKIKANAQIAQESLYEVCKGLKEMRDGKLYKELGYQNFEDYSENEVGITRMQSHRFVKIAESFTEENVTSMLHLGTTKLYFLTKLDEQEREELTQKVDIENISTRDLEKEIKSLKELNEGLTKRVTEEKKKAEAESSKAKATEQRLCILKVDKESLAVQAEQLKEKIRELENRPVEVAVQDNSEEIEKLKNEYEDQLAEKHGEYIAQLQIASERLKELGKLRAELEELKNAPAPEPEKIEVADTKELLKLYLENAIDTGNRLIGFLKKHPVGEYQERIRKCFQLLLEQAEKEDCHDTL